MDYCNLEQYKLEVETEVRRNILPFWALKAIDRKNGGFYGIILNDLTIDSKAAKGSVVCSRTLWAFARAYTVFSDNLYLDCADRAYEYLVNYFLDNDFGGVYWKTDYRGKPMETKKQIYAQAFAIYALSEYYHTTLSTKALHQAKDIFNLVEEYGFDRQYGGYYNAFNRDWSVTPEMQLSKKEINAPKTMNTNLHILEGYTNLLRCWNNRTLRHKLEDLLLIIIRYIIDPLKYHLRLYFQDNWKELSGHISYGHDIEASWLITEAAEILNDASLTEETKNLSQRMAEITIKEGVARDGSIWNEGNPKGPTDLCRDWWPQAEAMIGFLNAFQISRKEKFLRASLNSWNFIKEYLIDKHYGEWLPSVDRYGNAKIQSDKASLWKGPYHNTRACLEVRERLIHIIGSR